MRRRRRGRSEAKRPRRRGGSEGATRLVPLVAGGLAVGLVAGVVVLAVLGRRPGERPAKVGLDAGAGPGREALVVRDGRMDLAGLRRAALLLRRPDALRRGSDGAWLLSVPVSVRQGGRLEVHDEALRLRSAADGFVGLEARGGELQIRDSTVTSWDPVRGSFDAEPGDGRAYVLARDGARMDVSSSTLTRLGFDAVGRTGVSWSSRSTTGRVADGRFLANFEGASLVAAGPVELTGSRFERAATNGLGVGPRSRRSLVTGNVVADNARNGVVVAEGSHGAVVRGNRVHDNAGAGLSVGGSARVVVEDNDVWANTTGITVDQGAVDARITDNRVSANRGDGVVLASERSSATLSSNRLDHNGRAGVWIFDGQAVVGPRNTITKNEVGIGLADDTFVVGGLRNVIRENVTDVLKPGAPVGLRISDNQIMANSAAFAVRTAGDSRSFSATNTLEGNRLVERVEAGGQGSS